MHRHLSSTFSHPELQWLWKHEKNSVAFVTLGTECCKCSYAWMYSVASSPDSSQQANKQGFRTLPRRCRYHSVIKVRYMIQKSTSERFDAERIKVVQGYLNSTQPLPLTGAIHRTSTVSRCLSTFCARTSPAHHGDNQVSENKIYKIQNHRTIIYLCHSALKPQKRRKTKSW